MNKVSRRSFFKKAGMSAFGLGLTFQIVPSRVLGMSGVSPSGRINMAIIGNGLISAGHRAAFSKMNETQVLAVCDVNEVALKKAKEEADWYTKNRNNVPFRPVDIYSNYQEVLDRDDIDAVCICTPDHWHVAIALMAIQKGKAVYVEKPMSLTIEEGRILANAVKRHGGILQVGSQQRSDFYFRRAAELVRNGYIGNINTINTNIGRFPEAPKNLPEMPIPDGFDYDKWLGQTPWYPYNPARVKGDYGGGWRCFYEYGARKEGDWGAHHFDIIQWALGKDNTGPTDFYPENSNGSKFRHYIYKNGPSVFVNAPTRDDQMIQFIGDEGEICVSRNARFYCSNKNLLDIALKTKDTRLMASDHHRQNFIDAVRFGSENIATAEIGHRSATICHLMSMAKRLNEHVQWDPESEKVVNNPRAAAMVSRPRRSPYFLGA